MTLGRENQRGENHPRRRPRVESGLQYGNKVIVIVMTVHGSGFFGCQCKSSNAIKHAITEKEQFVATIGFQHGDEKLQAQQKQINLDAPLHLLRSPYFLGRKETKRLLFENIRANPVSAGSLLCFTWTHRGQIMFAAC